MSSKRDNIRFQAEQHELVPTAEFGTIEDYCIYLMHRKAYEYAATLASNKRVLDLGCNVGYWTHLLSKKSSMAFGVDVSRSATGEAQRRYGGEGVHFSLVDGVSLPFEDDQFDLVVSFEVIEHVT
ncbi:MAG: class I SAM-dependent methyltransferase, partial [Planctomycetota bacterium]